MHLNKVGRVIFTEEITLGVVRWTDIDKYCSNCFKKGEKTYPLISCSHCNFIHYCSKKCQVEDLVMHERECKLLIKTYNASDDRLSARISMEKFNTMVMESPFQDGVLPEHVPEAIRGEHHIFTQIFSRYVTRKAKRGEVDLSMWRADFLGNKVRYDFFLARLPHPRMTMRAISKIENDEKFRQKFLNLASNTQNLNEFLVSRYKSICTFMKASMATTLDLEEILKIDGIIRNNSFNSDFGFAQFIHASLFNHSCRPNALAKLTGRSVRIATVRKINPGDEITIEYTSEFYPKTARQASLKKNYGFTCECKGCRNDDPDERVQQVYFDLVSDNDIPWDIRLDLLEQLIRADHFMAFICLELLYVTLKISKIDRVNAQRLMSMILDENFRPKFGRFDCRNIYHTALECISAIPKTIQKSAETKIHSRLQDINVAIGEDHNSSLVDLARLLKI